MLINDFKIFRSVAEYGSFTKAAAATNTVQSNVTARIKFLETEFNTKLFERSSRKISLTDGGIELLKTVKEILLLLENAKIALGNSGELIKTVIKIGCIHTTAALRVPKILLSFNESYPEVEFKIKTGTSEDLKKEVLNFQLDGAFVSGEISDTHLEIQGVIAEELAIVSSGLIGSINELKKVSRRIKLIVFSDGCSYRKRVEQITSTWPNKITTIEMDTLEGIINAVEKGVGISLLPIELIEQHYQYKNLKAHRLPQRIAKAETVFIKRNNIAMSTGYTKFFKLLTESYKV